MFSITPEFVAFLRAPKLATYAVQGDDASVPQLPGVLNYGNTAEEAMAKAEVLALRAMVERFEHGESRRL